MLLVLGGGLLIGGALLLPLAAQAAPAAPSLPASARRRVRLTQSWIAPLEQKAEGVPIYDVRDGALLAHLTDASKRALDLEGTGRLPDGRVINHTGKAHHYRVLPPGRHGLGAGGRYLTPMRSVAVDLGSEGGKKPWKDSVTRGGPLIALGTRLHIEELVGLPLPDGGVHDGWVVAEDTGDAIYGAHLDLFVGDKQKRLKLPDLVSVAFAGSEEIPTDYTYGLSPADNYKALRPPRPRPRVA